MIVVPAVRRMLSAIESAEHSATRALNNQSIETEPSLTDRFLGALDEAFGREIEVDDYFLSVRTLRDRGPNSPEREFGADLVTVLRVSTADFTIAKGFLAQAKLAGKGEININTKNRHYPEVFVRRPKNDASDPTSLYSQCRQMLAVTPDSYVFVYSNAGIHVIPASSVVSLAPNGERNRVYMKLLNWFMSDFINSFIGDIRIHAYDDQTLRWIRDINVSTYAAMFQIRDRSSQQ